MAITTDNASNNNTFCQILESKCINENINFDKKNHHIRCIAHVLNLAVQTFLKSLKAEGFENENIIIDENGIDMSAIVQKVS